MPLDMFGPEHRQTLLLAAADRREEIRHNPDIPLIAHKTFSIPRIVSDLLNG
jgi:hypothetical protein